MAVEMNWKIYNPYIVIQTKGKQTQPIAREENVVNDITH
jgi:hypothetical protein